MKAKEEAGRFLAAAAIALLGIALALYQYARGFGDDPIITLLGVAPFVLMSLALPISAAWLVRNVEEPLGLIRIAVWCFGGSVAFASVAFLANLHQQVLGPGISISPLLIVDELTAGALVGLMVGVYEDALRNRERQLQVQNERVEAFARKAADVNNYGRLLSVAEDKDEVAALALEGVGILVGFIDAALIETDGDGIEVLDSTLSSGAVAESLEGVAREALDEGRAVLVDAEPMGGDEIRGTWLAVPADLEDVVEAVIVVKPRDPENYEEEDLRLLEILGSHVATALSEL